MTHHIAEEVACGRSKVGHLGHERLGAELDLHIRDMSLVVVHLRERSDRPQLLRRGLHERAAPGRELLDERGCPDARGDSSNAEQRELAEGS